MAELTTLAARSLRPMWVPLGPAARDPAGDPPPRPAGAAPQQIYDEAGPPRTGLRAPAPEPDPQEAAAVTGLLAAAGLPAPHPDSLRRATHDGGLRRAAGLVRDDALDIWAGRTPSHGEGTVHASLLAEHQQLALSAVVFLALREALRVTIASSGTFLQQMQAQSDIGDHIANDYLQSLLDKKEELNARRRRIQDPFVADAQTVAVEVRNYDWVPTLDAAGAPIAVVEAGPLGEQLQQLNYDALVRQIQRAEGAKERNNHRRERQGKLFETLDQQRSMLLKQMVTYVKNLQESVSSLQANGRG